MLGNGLFCPVTPPFMHQEARRGVRFKCKSGCELCERRRQRVAAAGVRRKSRERSSIEQNGGNSGTAWQASRTEGARLRTKEHCARAMNFSMMTAASVSPSNRRRPRRILVEIKTQKLFKMEKCYKINRAIWRNGVKSIDGRNEAP